VIYDGACPFCDSYVRYQRLQAAADKVELIDARTHPEVLAEHAIAPAELEEGMVVVVDGKLHRGGDAVHWLSVVSDEPGNWWVRAVAALSRSPVLARLAYPFLRFGRRIALTALRVPRFPRD
jgi:predicted DCC family thiol-disulfide oxidoreductase YuxK